MAPHARAPLFSTEFHLAMIETEETPALAGPSRNNALDPNAAPPATPASDRFEMVIRPASGWTAVDWREMYEYRELLFFLVWRDISVRYKQTVLGGAWAILQPLIMVAIFSFMMRYANIETPMNLPPVVFVFAALVPWTMFAQGMPAAANSLISALNMVTKVYFPRLFLPITAAAVYLVDGVLSLLIFAPILLYYGIVPQWTIIFVPLLFLLTLIATLSLGVLLAGLTLFYRDFRHIVPFMIQILMYVTGLFYPISMIPAKYHALLSLNPMFGIIDAYRAAILGTPMHWDCFLISSSVAIGLFIFSLRYFRRAERLFADYV